MKRLVLLAVAAALVGCAATPEQPKLSREAALKMIADSAWVSELRFEQWQGRDEVMMRDVVVNSFDYEWKSMLCADLEKARRALGLPTDFFIIDSFNHKRIGQWKHGKLTIY